MMLLHQQVRATSFSGYEEFPKMSAKLIFRLLIDLSVVLF